MAQLTIQQADVSFAPAKYLGKQTQSWRGWVEVTAREPGSLQGTSGEEGMLRAGWSHGPPCILDAGCSRRAVLAGGGVSVQDGAPPKRQHGRKAKKKSSAWKSPHNGSRDGSRNVHGGGRSLPHQERDSTSLQLKEGHLSHTWGSGRTRHGAAPSSAPCVQAHDTALGHREMSCPLWGPLPPTV